MVGCQRTQLRQTINDSLERVLLVTIDVRALTFIDSTGLHAIIDADARAHQTGHRLVLIRGSAQINRLFQVVGLTDRLKIVDLSPDATPVTDSSAA